MARTTTVIAIMSEVIAAEPVAVTIEVALAPAIEVAIILHRLVIATEKAILRHFDRVLHLLDLAGTHSTSGYIEATAVNLYANIS